MVRLILSIFIFCSYYQLSYAKEPVCNTQAEGQMFYDKSAENSRNGGGVLKYCDGKNWIAAMHTYGECKLVRQVACGERNANAQCGDGYIAVGGHGGCWVSWDLQADLAGECGKSYYDFHDQDGVQDVTSELYVSGFSKGRKGWIAGCHTKKIKHMVPEKLYADVPDKFCKNGNYDCNTQYHKGVAFNHNIKIKQIDYASGFHAPKMAIAWCCKAPQELIDRLKLDRVDYENKPPYWD
jgi:hypothetical protein